MFKFSFTLPNIDQLDVYKQHQQLTAIFTNSPKVRFRIDDETGVTVYSEKPPVGSIQCKTSILKNYAVGDIIKFRLRANVEKREFIRNGKGSRVGIREPELVAKWFNDQATRCGFSLENMIGVSPPYCLRGNRDGRPLMYNTVDFEGILKITDEDKFKESYENGVGSAKGFGFGLLVADYELKR